MKIIPVNKNLTDFLLGHFRERPHFYLGQAKISLLPTFISGYNVGFHIANEGRIVYDYYFDEPGFLRWFENKYEKGPTSNWISPFLDEANDDEKLALELFFKYLEEFKREKDAALAQDPKS